MTEEKERNKKYGKREKENTLKNQTAIKKKKRNEEKKKPRNHRKLIFKHSLQKVIYSK